MFVTTALALDSNETSFKAPTVQVRIEFIAHERGQARPLLTYRVEERPGVLLDGLIESCVFGFIGQHLQDLLAGSSNRELTY